MPGVLSGLPGSDGPKVKDSEGTVEQAGNKGHDVGNVLKGAAIGAEGGGHRWRRERRPGQGSRLWLARRCGCGHDLHPIHSWQ